jgi:hypothetical protein
MTKEHDYGVLKDVSGRFRTLSLFIEECKSTDTPQFSLKRYQKTGLPPSLYLKYMEVADPSEYRFAMEVFGSWEHWLVLAQCNFFKKHITEWRGDLKAKLRSQHYENMKALSVSSTAKVSDKIAATKWLATNSGYEKIRDVARGRPSNDEVEGRLKQELKRLEEDTEDFDRLGL